MIPDAELVTLEAIRAIEPSVKAGTRVPPENAPDGFVMVRRIGGGFLGKVQDRPTVDVMVFHSDDFQRSALANRIRAGLAELPGTTVAGIPIYSVTEFLGPRRVPDPANPDRTVTLFSLSIALRAVRN